MADAEHRVPTLSPNLDGRDALPRVRQREKEGSCPTTQGTSSARDKQRATSAVRCVGRAASRPLSPRVR